VATHTLIVGNGDVLSRQQGEDLAKQYSLDGVMIGRGIFQDPYLFAKESPWPNKTQEERIELLRHHVTEFTSEWADDRRFETLKKFAKVYISDFDGAKELREKIMSTTSATELFETLNNR